VIHQCVCGFATDDRLWFESHQAQHLLKREHDVTGLSAAELDRARRDLRVSLTLAWPGSPVREPILAQMAAIDAELTGRTTGDGSLGSPLP
jgi:hypothetical protein